jgi:hypothetical protein
VPVNAVAAACLAYGISALFFPALRASERVRVVVFGLLAVLVALTPWTIPAEARIARFIMAVYAAVLVLKMWDLHLGAGRSVHPRLAEFLGFLANVASLVHRRTGSERQPTPRENSVRLFKALVGVSLGLLAFNILLWLDWGSSCKRRS